MPDRRLELLIELENQKALKDLTKFNMALGTTDKQTAKATKAFNSFIGALKVTAIAAAAKHLVQVASDAEEVDNKFNVVFSTISEESKKAAEELARSYGLSTKASKELLANTGDLLTGFGFAQKESLGLSRQVNKLAVDLASFTNYAGGAKGASEAITKALLGETEQMKSLGVAIRQNTKEFRAQVEAQMEATGASEQQAKAHVILNEIMKQSKNAIGDFARSEESFANQTRIAMARVEDLAGIAGEKLLPIATDLIKQFAGLAEELQENEGLMMILAGSAEIVGAALSIALGIISAGLKIIGDFALGVNDLIEGNNSLVRQLEKSSKAFSKEADEIENLQGRFTKLREKETLTKKERKELLRITEDLSRVTSSDISQTDLLTGSLKNLNEQLNKEKQHKKELATISAREQLLEILKEEEKTEGRLARKQEEYYLNAQGLIDAKKNGNWKVLELAKENVNQSILEIQLEKDKLAEMEKQKTAAEDLIRSLETENALRFAGVTGQPEANVEKQVEAKTEVEEAKFQVSVDYAAKERELFAEKLAADRSVYEEEVEAKREAEKKKKEAAEKSFKAQIAMAKEYAEISSTVLNGLSGISNQYYKNELANAEGNAEKTKQLKREQFIVNKALSVGESIINTANAVTAQLAQGNLPLAIAVGAMGAVQTGLIAAEPVPAFAQGGSFRTNGEQMIKVGDNSGGVEDVTITPVSSFGNDSPGGTDTPIIIQIDSTPIYQGMLRASKDRTLLIDQGAIV